MDGRAGPATPRRRDLNGHNRINEIVDQLNRVCDVALPLRDVRYSPSSNDRKGSASLESKCYTLVTYIHWKGRTKLEMESILNEFKKRSLPRSYSERLNGLHKRLHDEYISIQSTLASNTSGDSRVDELDIGRSQPLQVRPTGAHIRQPNFKPHDTVEDEPQTLVPLSNAPNTSVIPTANGSRRASRTESDESENEFETPPESPSLLAQDSTRRTLAGAPVHYPDLRDFNSPRKRLSEENITADERCTKFSRTSNRIPGNANPMAPPAFNAAVKEATSFESGSTAPTSAAVSLGSTVASDGGHVTEKTSFMTDMTEITLPPNSSATIDSLDSETWHEVSRKYEESWHPSSSTIGDFGMNDPLSPELSEAESVDQVKRGPPPTTASEHFQLKHLWNQNFFIEDVPRSYAHYSFLERWECARIAIANDVSITTVLQELSGSTNDPAIFYSQFGKGKQSWYKTETPQADPRVWKSTDYEGWTFKVSITFNPKEQGLLFILFLYPPSRDLSSRYQRKFGADRIMDVLIPSVRNLPRHHKKASQAQVIEKLRDWQSREHKFLGRKWQALYLEQLKGDKTDRLRGQLPPMRAKFFATDGYDLLPRTKEQRKKSKHGVAPPKGHKMDLYEVIDWHMNLSSEQNRQQPFPKSFARIELGFSRTQVLLVVTPSEKRLVGDILADGSPEDTRFNDMSLDWTGTPEPNMVMTDGAAEISDELLREAWSRVNPGREIPSAVQGRIGNAKGLWLRSKPTRERWIQIRDSQAKFEPHTIDNSQTSFDESRNTFEVIKYSKFPRQSNLNADLATILVARGVAHEVLLELMRNLLDRERKEILDLFASVDDCPLRVRKWMYDNVESRVDRFQNGDVAMEGALPRKLVERINLLIDSGFNPSRCLYLGHKVQNVLMRHLMSMAKDFRLPVPKSTLVFGAPDFEGVLAPGEVHLQFSQKFLDKSTGESFLSLAEYDVLVARHPCLRPSDVQKVRVVSKPELSHIVDVLIFPTRGMHALANKLQGGDYDGDTFWICWEPTLTQPFRNAPAPVTSPKPEDYGIGVERTTLGELLSEPGSVREFLDKSFTFQFNDNILGHATNTYQSLCYNTGSMTGEGPLKLCDVHDLLVDSKKSGYIFGFDQFGELKKKYGGGGSLFKEPPHKRSMKEIAKAKFSSEELDNLIPTLLKRPHKIDDIKDQLFFGVLIPHIKQTGDELLQKVGTASFEDDDLSNPYTSKKIRAFNCRLPDELPIKQELESLEQQLDELYKLWAKKWRSASEMDKDKRRGEFIDDCHKQYLDIKPQNCEHPIVHEWLNPIPEGAPSTWSLLKASALFNYRHATNPAFVWQMAGDELVYIKAHSSRNARTIVGNIWSGMKPRKLGALQRDIIDLEDAEAEENDLDDFLETSDDDDGDDDDEEDDIAADSY